MDTDTLRLILLFLGASFILALYLWERGQDDGSNDTDAHDDERDDERDAYPPATRRAATERRSRREPNLGRCEDPDTGFEDADDANDRDQAGRRSPTPAAYPSPATQPEPDPAPDPLLIQIGLSARVGTFAGPDILEAASASELYPGTMSIFHRADPLDDEADPYFSMANMVKPGTFPFADLDAFTTPGLLLFAQLEGDPDDLAVLDDMLAAAREMASALDGEVVDARRRPLTVKQEEEIRARVRAYGRERAGYGSL